jgi:hypothetical protein
MNQKYIDIDGQFEEVEVETTEDKELVKKVEDILENLEKSEDDEF